MVQIVRKDCIAGLWEHMKDQFADLKTTVMDAIMDIVQPQVIQAGIKWVMGLLTPVGAFIKAAMAIIDVVKFFIQRASQIMELVKASTDSIKAIASGNVGAVAKSIENALGRAVSVLIGFLASLLGIGGLADKVLGVIRKIRQRIENAIVKFWNFIKGKAKGLLGRKDIENIGKKEKKGEDFRTIGEKRKDLDEGVKEGTQLLRDIDLDRKEIQKRLKILEDRYDLQELKIVTDKTKKDEETVHIHGKVNPEKDGDKVKINTELGEEGKEIDLNNEVEKAVIPEKEVEIQIQKLLDAGAKSTLFRGDNNYNGGDIGLELNSEEAKNAEIQDPYTHVQDNENGESTIYRSFSIRMAMPNGNGPQKFARKDKIFKIELAALQELIKEGRIKIYTPLDIKNIVMADGKSKSRKLADAVYASMVKNGEILIEGQIPAKYIIKTK